MKGILTPAALSVATLAALAACQTASAEDIKSLAVVESSGQTRALIEVAESVEYSVFALSKPNRLVLDLHNSRFARGFRPPGPNGVVANVRTGQPTPGEARVVFDLSSNVRPRAFFQHKDGRVQLVVELTDANAPAVAASQPSALVANPAGNGFATVAEPLKQKAITDKVTVIQTAPPPIQLSPAQFRDANLRVDPPISTAVIVPEAQPDQPSTISTPDDSPVVAVDSKRAPHSGARTVRDMFGTHQRKLVVAIDAGHGGQDPGAHGLAGTLEKNATLAVARELARQINAEPGMQAVLTRDGDYFIPLADRYRKARKAKADIFISIHADADPTHTATGSSVFVLSQRGASSQAARWLADQENASDLIGGVSLGDKDSTLASVLLDLSQSATMRASDDVARTVLGALRNLGKTHKSDVERANFVVLRSPDVPSMLVETAFITNAGEEQHLNDPGYRTRLASAITGGVRSFFAANPLPGTIFAKDETPTAVPMQIARADTPTSASRQHLVKRGESLDQIADAYDVSVRDLRLANGISSMLKPRAGTHLTIPGRGRSF
ncbi:MAG: N-acetylmuramoyl-L-alanine amidase [Lysobacteraceae bacterium]